MLGSSKKFYRAFGIGECSKANRLLMTQNLGQPQKIYRAFWQGQCSKADRLAVKESVGQPPYKNFTGRSRLGIATRQIDYW